MRILAFWGCAVGGQGAQPLRKISISNSKSGSRAHPPHALPKEKRTTTQKQPLNQHTISIARNDQSGFVAQPHGRVAQTLVPIRPAGWKHLEIVAHTQCATQPCTTHRHHVFAQGALPWPPTVVCPASLARAGFGRKGAWARASVQAFMQMLKRKPTQKSPLCLCTCEQANKSLINTKL